MVELGGMAERGTARANPAKESQLEAWQRKRSTGKVEKSRPAVISEDSTGAEWASKSKNDAKAYAAKATQLEAGGNIQSNAWQMRLSAW